MKLYGHFISPPANQVRLTASAININHEYCHVDLASGEQKSPTFLKINPHGKVPAMDDGGFSLGESGAICRYMSNKQETKLYPTEIKARGEIDQWMDYSAHHIRTNLVKMLFNKVVGPMLGAPTSAEAIEEGRGFLNDLLPAADAAIEKNGFVAGKTLSIADTALLSNIEPLGTLGYDLSAHKNIEDWLGRLMSEAWYKKVHSHYMAEAQG